LQHGLNANVVRKWIRQTTAKSSTAKSTSPAILLPVTVTSVPLNDQQEVAALPRPRQLKNDGKIDIELRGARVTLQGAVDAETLRCVLTLLRQA